MGYSQISVGKVPPVFNNMIGPGFAQELLFSPSGIPDAKVGGEMVLGGVTRVTTRQRHMASPAAATG
jgi:hypothetical protein